LGVVFTTVLVVVVVDVLVEVVVEVEVTGLEVMGLVGTFIQLLPVLMYPALQLTTVQAPYFPFTKV
jgi:hypothetical protein